MLSKKTETLQTEEVNSCSDMYDITHSTSIIQTEKTWEYWDPYSVNKIKNSCAHFWQADF